ncbi:queuosine biosynthesis protein [Pantoea phage vB_PagS_Vid5]|uniref:Queuosine biosynthesis protein n=1 Tax=Pantoea phage vB_PagS_Vid5 TaxID=2099652 RepID=A0A2P1CLA1_9CAUD|nr:QueE-like radical SAM domain [Pantoea phage vB_PagS_Vid5]AVJ51795.1 queuosine biosynthesis protein [Pantoea phage vB_PagS_Vid5]
MRLNKQPPEKRDMRDDGTLDVHSIFSTIQGEGPFCGHASVFVRLAGCNVQCPGCDTLYTNGRTRYYVEDIVKLVNSERIKDGNNCDLVVITGGEPFRQKLDDLIMELTENDFRVQIETNGTLPVPDVLKQYIPIGEYGAFEPAFNNSRVTVVCSPKGPKIHESIAQRADCFKYVMQADSIREEDGLPIEALQRSIKPYLARPPVGYDKPIYLQPMDEQDPVKNERNIKAVLGSCKKHNYILQLQIHKYLGVE